MPRTRVVHFWLGQQSKELFYIKIYKIFFNARQMYMEVFVLKALQKVMTLARLRKIQDGKKASSSYSRECSASRNTDESTGFKEKR